MHQPADDLSEAQRGMKALQAKWLEIFVGAAWLVAMAAFAGAFGNRLYIAVIAIFAAYAVAGAFWIYVWISN